MNKVIPFPGTFKQHEDQIRDLQTKFHRMDRIQYAHSQRIGFILDRIKSEAISTPVQAQNPFEVYRTLA